MVDDRVVERRRDVALARHYRDAEGLSIAQIADRLGRSPATIKAYFYDPTGEKARAVKARYRASAAAAVLTRSRGMGRRRLRILQCLPPRRDRPAVYARAHHRLHARLARPLRPSAVVLRFVAHPRPSAWRRVSRATERRRLALRERHDRRLRELESDTFTRPRSRLVGLAMGSADRRSSFVMCGLARRRSQSPSLPMAAQGEAWSRTRCIWK